MVNSSKSIRYYRQFYTLISIAVIVMMAVLSGSLLLGDSVRGTLVNRVHERLGNAETIITSGTGFLNEEIMQNEVMREATGYLLVEGFVSSGDKLIPVFVWGSDADSISSGNALVNEPLARQLSDDDFVLHLPSHSLVPSGSLFVTKQYSTQMRLHKQGVKTVEQGGNLLLHNEQTLPLNVFVNRQELAELMDLKGKINLIMSPSIISNEDFCNVWSPAYSGIFTEGDNLTSDRIFLPQSIVESLQPQRTCFAYLVNDIYNDVDSVPYSFVTAVDNWKGEKLAGNEMVLSDYASERMKARVGDTLKMDYFIAKGMKSLDTRTRSFVVKAIVPLQEIQQDTLLMTEYPGLSNVEKCTDWDSDLPINMSRIAKEDEDFWYAYKQTPKALVSYDAVKSDWSMPFGVATALQIKDASEAVKHITPKQMGVLISHPHEEALYLAQNGTDFSSLFLALGFFIILSGILLMQNPLLEMLEKRRGEVELYRTLGFAPQRIYMILSWEIGRVVLCASPIGVLAGILYSGITLFLLGNVWSGATHTEGFALHVSMLTLLIGWIVGMVICGLTVWLALRSFMKGDEIHAQKQKTRSYALTLYISIALAITTVAAFLYNIMLAHSIIIFVCCGLLWLISSGLFLLAYICKSAMTTNIFSHRSMMWKSLESRRSQNLLAFWSLSVGVFTVFSVGLNRPDFSHSTEDASITGGFDLWCECRVPVEYDMNNADVRKKLSVSYLDDNVRFMHILQHTQDEASCLNLNKVVTPTVLGVDLDELKNCFYIETDVLVQSNADVVPVLIDSESLTWSLMKSVGDTLTYESSEGEPVRLLIAGTYPTGIFHGNALMDKAQFGKIWKEETGSRILLIKTGNEKLEETKELLETAMSEYGLRITTTTERIELFFTVTDTYLAIFLTLGGLGLLLGVFCLVIVVRKNLASRKEEINTLLALGYPMEQIRQMLVKENLVVPLFAIVMGSVGSVISISANVAGAGFATILTAIVFLVALLVLVNKGIIRIIQNNI